MKTRFFIAGCACVWLVAGALGQGTLNFVNRDPSLGFDQPVFDCDWVTKLGPGFVAQLIAGPNENALAPVGPAGPFRAGYGVGYWMANPDPTRVVATVGSQAEATCQVWVWDGQYPTLNAAMAAGAKWGKSAVFTQKTGGAGGVPLPPQTIDNFRSFALECVPEPATLAQFALGIPLFSRRRRRP